MHRRRIYQRAKYLYAFANCLGFSRWNNHHVVINNSDKFLFGTADWSYSQWLFPYEIGAGHANMQGSFSKGGGNIPGVSGFFRTFENDASKWVFGVEARNQDNAAKYAQALTTKHYHVWNHMVLAREGLFLRLYLNGELVASGNILATDNFDSLQPFYLGYGGATWYLHGWLDDFIVFDKALNLVEVQTIYNNGNGAGPPESCWENIRAYWFFDELEGRILNDYSNTYNPTLTSFQNGTLVNFTDIQVTPGPDNYWFPHHLAT